MRVALTLAALAPVGLLMGMPMPVGLRRTSDVAWAWGINGTAGVLASVFAVVLAVVAGFSAAFGRGARLLWDGFDDGACEERAVG